MRTTTSNRRPTGPLGHRGPTGPLGHRGPSCPPALPRRVASRRAFTLLEIMVVVTIIALLATLVVPRVWQHIGTSKQRVTQAAVESLAQQVNLWMIDAGHSRLPDDFDLVLLSEGDRPLVVRKDLDDPWGRMFVLINPGVENPSDFDIVSYGADGEPGGEGEDADVVN